VPKCKTQLIRERKGTTQGGERGSRPEPRRAFLYTAALRADRKEEKRGGGEEKSVAGLGLCLKFKGGKRKGRASKKGGEGLGDQAVIHCHERF